jgi:hypothetical protein
MYVNKALQGKFYKKKKALQADLYKQSEVICTSRGDYFL